MATRIPPAQTAPPSAVTDALRDKRLTEREWTTKVAPAVADGGVENLPARELLETLFDPTLRIDPVVRANIANVLRAHGYELGPDGTPNLPLDQIKQLNATAPDLMFRRLSAALGELVSTVGIAVVDGGFSAHPTLMDNVGTTRAAYGAAIGTSFGRFSRAAREEGAVHGTHVAGIATAGTSRIKADLHATRLATAEELRSGEPEPPRPPARKDPLFRAIDEAAEDGARIVNVSIEAWATAENAKVFEDMLRSHPNTLFVFGAGNDSWDLTPAAQSAVEESLVTRLPKLDNVAVVGASYPNGGIWHSSNRGADIVDLAARGHVISSADGDGDGLRTESGTSMAAPQVTNTAAKMLLLDGTLTPAQLVRIMAVTSDPHPSWEGKSKTGGTMNPDRAMTVAAARALIRTGASEASAFEKLDVPSAERAAIRAALAELSQAARPRGR